MNIKINGEEMTFIEKVNRVHEAGKEFDQSIAELTPVTEAIYNVHTFLMSPLYDGVEHIGGLFY